MYDKYMIVEEAFKNVEAGGEVTGDITDVALKYLSSAILHAIEEEAQKLQITSQGAMQGNCKLLGKKETYLPKPPIGLAREMMGIVRCITGLETDIGESKLAYGLRNDRLEIDVTVHKSGEKEVMGLRLPTARQEAGSGEK